MKIEINFTSLWNPIFHLQLPYNLNVNCFIVMWFLITLHEKPFLILVVNFKMALPHQVAFSFTKITTTIPLLSALISPRDNCEVLFPGEGCGLYQHDKITSVARSGIYPISRAFMSSCYCYVCRVPICFRPQYLSPQDLLSRYHLTSRFHAWISTNGTYYIPDYRIFGTIGRLVQSETIKMLLKTTVPHKEWRAAISGIIPLFLNLLHSFVLVA